MTRTNNIKTLSLATGAALALSVIGSSAMAGQSNPFGMTELSAGYSVAAAEAKCGEGKCGGNMKKTAEAKCGGMEKKAEAKCGGNKAAESKCGGNKAAESKCGGNKAKAAEAKCGEGKCGGNKKAAESKCGGSK